MVGLPVKLTLIENFDEGLEFYKKKLKSLKTSLDPFGVLYLFGITVNLPFFLPRLMINLVSNKYSMVFSNS